MPKILNKQKRHLSFLNFSIRIACETVFEELWLSVRVVFLLIMWLGGGHVHCIIIYQWLKCTPGWRLYSFSTSLCENHLSTITALVYKLCAVSFVPWPEVLKDRRAKLCGTMFVRSFSVAACVYVPLGEIAEHEGHRSWHPPPRNHSHLTLFSQRTQDQTVMVEKRFSRAWPISPSAIHC